MKLRSMLIENFGCFASKTINFSDGETIISGRNASGKTTIKNAFFWVLGIDSGIKARHINSDGTANYMMNPCVILTVDRGGSKLELERRLVAKSTALGEAKENSIFYVNGFEVSKKDYLNQVMTELGIDTVTLNFISAPESFFQGTVADRRNNLLNLLCIHENDFYTNEVRAALKGHGIEENITSLKREMKDSEKMLDYIPKQIEEAKLGIPNITESREELEKQAVELKIKLRVAEESCGKEDVKKISAAEGALYKAEKDLELIEKAYIADIDYLTMKKQNAETVENSTAETISELIEQRKTVNDEYIALKDEKYEGTNLCPTCGHELPAALMQSYIEKFNAEKAEKLRTMLEKGKRLGTKIKELQAKLDNAKSDRLAAENALARLKEEHPIQVDSKKHEIAGLKKAFEKSKDDLTTISKSNLEAEDIRRRLADIETKILNLAIADERMKRVAELEKQLEAAKNVYSGELEKYNNLIEVRRKVGEELEKAVNSKFRYIKWKLTEVLKNGETTDICTAVVNGVPWNYVNSGSRINALLDAYNVICMRHEVPLWLDNAEQVTDWLNLGENRQVIKLYAADKPLTIEGE